MAAVPGAVCYVAVAAAITLAAVLIARETKGKTHAEIDSGG